MNKLKEYFKQPSTYKGLAVIISLIGMTVAPGAVETIGAAIIAIIGIHETARNEKPVQAPVQ